MTFGISAAGVAAAAGVASAAMGANAAHQANKAGAASAKAASGQAYSSAADSYRATEMKYKQLQQDYAATDQQNLMTLVRQNYRTGLMHVQKGAMKRDQTAKGFDTSQQAAAFLGAASANAAASQTIGASSEVVKADILMKVGEAQATHDQNYQQQLQNFNSEVEAMRLNNETQFTSPKELVYSSTGDLSDPINVGSAGMYQFNSPWNNIAAGVGAVAGLYMKNSTSLNLGAPPPATAAGYKTQVMIP